MENVLKVQLIILHSLIKINNNSYLYWLEENGHEVKGRFLRQESFALNNQFLR